MFNLYRIKQVIISLQSDIAKIIQTIKKYPRSERIAAQRRVCRIYIAGLKT